MTKAQFKENLLRGRGCCMQAVRFEPNKYDSILLWACDHVVAFDTQCEGTRAWFVYQLLNEYEDKTRFLEKAIAGLRKAKSDGGWKILYLAELLAHFADDGEELAEQELWSKYEILYNTLMARKRLPAHVFHERDDFEMLCLVLANSSAAMSKIAEDIGRLYLTNKIYDGSDFEWLYESKVKRYRGYLTKQSQKSKYIVEFLQAGEVNKEKNSHESQTFRRVKSGAALSVWLRKKANKETVQEYVNVYLNQRDPDARAKALEAFSRCPFPENPVSIIQDAQSDYMPLKQAAWQALQNIRHPSVREFAIEEIDKETENALPALILNYDLQDEGRLLQLVKSIKVDFECTTMWHSIQCDILNMKDHGVKAPASLLWYIYESTYCSCCREYALYQMGSRRLLTTEILEECLFDSNVDIRMYAQKCLSRRKKKIQQRA